MKTENYIDEDLENSDSNNQTESDIDNEEQFVKNSTCTILITITFKIIHYFFYQYT